MEKDIKREFEILTGSSSYNPEKGDYWHSSIGKLRVKYKSSAESPFALSRGKVSEFLRTKDIISYNLLGGMKKLSNFSREIISSNGNPGTII